MYSFEVNHRFRIAKFCPQRLETSFYGMVQSIFRYLELWPPRLEVVQVLYSRSSLGAGAERGL